MLLYNNQGLFYITPLTPNPININPFIIFNLITQVSLIFFLIIVTIVDKINHQIIPAIPIPVIIVRVSLIVRLALPIELKTPMKNIIVMGFLIVKKKTNAIV